MGKRMSYQQFAYNVLLEELSTTDILILNKGRERRLKKGESNVDTAKRLAIIAGGTYVGSRFGGAAGRGIARRLHKGKVKTFEDFGKLAKRVKKGHNIGKVAGGAGGMGAAMATTRKSKKL
jgi:hypothetical protein